MYSICFPISVAILLPIYTQYIGTGSRESLRAIRGAPENDDGVNSEIHSEAMSVQVLRYTWMQYSSIVGDTLGGRDQATSEMNLESMIK
jgi:hypothetical protein